MARARLVLLSAVVIAGFTAVPAHADPAPPCAFTLSPPAVVHVDGADMVSVTVSPDACGAPANPRFSVACVQRQDNASPVQCNQGKGATPAEVRTPYRPGASYVSTGRGCGGWMGIAEIAPQCQVLGPLSAPL
ncbi:hypothetical protein A5666_16855 [Mycolicibacterium fortuitum]|uniref:Secreted protein n=1 Tax=Mycolicibacterium fortuitum TaxID=1766 RepID=A0ABD6QBU5_MYCFO|nr:hypothetical protein [Mycolicibacterium fortuitum]OBA94382.1 hypothetical protein A5665_07320 [Mycolicibacterium fortuitum]OBI59955.1 hypothetical protein A5666_16855 [Mycolicibacterium fortuitum]OMC32738.1 hypothetical protein A5742_15400 [Mycolicibacterium fortuitum]